MTFIGAASRGVFTLVSASVLIHSLSSSSSNIDIS